MVGRRNAGADTRSVLPSARKLKSKDRTMVGNHSVIKSIGFNPLPVRCNL